MTEEQKFRLAAKACGKDLTKWVWNERKQQVEWDFGSVNPDEWNPRDDDGDSFRLMVDCSIECTYLRWGVQAVLGDLVIESFDGGDIQAQITYKSTPDKHAATRLAVLNCAAAIGEAME